MPQTRDLVRQELGGGFGRRLRQKRLELGYSVDKLAEMAQLGRAQIVRIERGEGGDAGIATVAMIAAGLGVSPGWLAFGAD